MAIDQLNISQSGKEILINELFDSLLAKFTLGIHRSATVGLTLGLYGGPFLGLSLANQTLTLPASSTRYIEADATLGTAYATATAYTAGRIPLGVAVTSSSGLTSYTPVDRENWLGGGGGGTAFSLSDVHVFTKNQSVAPVALTDGATISVDASLSNNFKVALSGNRTLANPTNLTDGMVLNLKVKQDATGGRTLAYGTKYKWGGGTAPVLSTAANAIDFVSAYYDAADDILIGNIIKGVA